MLFIKTFKKCYNSLISIILYNGIDKEAIRIDSEITNKVRDYQDN